MKKMSRFAAAAVAALSLSFATPAISHAVTEGMAPVENSVADSVVKVGTAGINSTGVMISPSWGLTAAHSVDLPAVGEVSIIAPIQAGVDRSEGVYAATIYRHPDNPDIALFNINGVHEGTYAELPDRRAQIGDDGYFVGFGGNGETVSTAQALDAGVTRLGNGGGKWSNTKIVRFDPENGNLLKGDSGGPLFIGNQVHGIFSHGGIKDGKFTYGNAVEVAYYLDWIEEVTGIDTVGTDAAYANNARYTGPAHPVSGYQNPVVIDNGPATHIPNSTSSIPDSNSTSSQSLVTLSSSLLS